jgi:hypothetical protein
VYADKTGLVYNKRVTEFSQVLLNKWTGSSSLKNEVAVKEVLICSTGAIVHAVVDQQHHEV